VFAVELCKALEGEGVDCTLLSSDQTTLPDRADTPRATHDDLPAAAAGLDVRIFPVRYINRLVITPELSREARREARRADVIHVHSLWLYPQWAAGRAARAAKRPYVVSVHGALDAWMRKQNPGRKAVVDTTWQRRFLRNADALHVLSDAEVRNIADIAPAVPRILAPFGLTEPPPADEAASAAFRAGIGVRTDQRLIAFVGRVAEKKGVDVLIESFALLRSTTAPDAHLAIVGPDENMTAQLKQLAQRLGVTDAVSFTGALYGADLWASIRAADVWALPSQTENFSIAVVEACAAGVPVVCSPGVGAAEAGRAAGAVDIAERTPQDFAAALTRILTDDVHAAALRAAGPVFASSFGWPAIARTMRAGYEQCVERGPRG
jgi:glycosyltransferase involved in cell wall biosynthesis